MAKKEKDKFDVEEFRKQVNEFDKSFGIKLKSCEIYNEPDKVFNIAVSKYEMHIAMIICLLNGINPKDYFAASEEFGTVWGPIGKDEPAFTSQSDLEWNYDKKYGINSTMFRSRFLTIYLSEMMFRLDKVSMNRFIESSNRVGCYEHGYFYLKQTVDDLDRLTMLMLGDKSYRNILLKNHQNSVYLKKKTEKKKELNKILFEAIEEVREGSKTTKFSGKFMDDDMLIYSLLRLAYMLSTHALDVSGAIPKFKYIKKATKEDDLIKLIAELGHSIMVEHKYEKRPTMYRAFNDAHPLLRSNYKDANDDMYINIGIRALYYTDFLLCDKDIHKFIEYMVNLC